MIPCRIPKVGSDMFLNMSETTASDRQLLDRYTSRHAEDAFAEIVRRHLALVHSAALRQVRSPQLAEEVAQSVFTDLARQAQRLAPDTVLTAWLYQVTRRTAIDVVRREASRQLREQIATEMNAINATDADWTHIEPLLDDAMHALDETDRTAVLLRYFENKSLREVGVALGTSDDAAQKRVSRAVEQLREFLAQRGVTVGASGLVVVISTNAVLVAPAGLSAAITAAALAGTTIATTAIAVAVKTIAISTTQKIAITFVLAAFLFIAAYKAYHATKPRSELAQTVARTEPSGVRTDSTAKSVFGKSHSPLATTPVDSPLSAAAREFYERGMTHDMEQRYDEALADYTSAVGLIEQGLPVQSWFYDLYFSRGSLYSGHQKEAKRNYAQAVADYTKALELKPDEYSARGNRGLAYASLRQYEQAVADYTKIIEDPSTDFSHSMGGSTNGIAWAYEYRGRARHDAKDYANAIADYTEALRLGKESDDEITIHWRIGSCYKSSQDHGKATAEADWLAERALRWATSTSASGDERNHALLAARFASELFDHKQPYQLEVLAATKAKAGEFGEAVSEQKRAISLINPSTEQQRPAMRARLELYEAGKPLPAR